MAISRQQKEDQVKRLAESFADAKLTVLADYQGLSVQELQELRKLLKDQGSSLKVAKLNLMKRALKDVDESIFSGPVALAFGSQDEVAPAQVLAKYAKDHPALEMVAGIDSEGNVLTADQVTHLASLPGKDQLRGHLVGTIAAPVSGFVTVLRANISGLVQVLNAYSQSKS